MRARPAAAFLAAALAAAPATAGSPGADAAAPGDGYRLLESTVAAVNGEVVFLSDVVREACFLSCGALPGDEPAPTTLAAARERYIADVLVLQEQRKLALGQVDNAALGEISREARARVARCASPCRDDVTPAQVEAYVARRILVRDFLVQRVSVFVEVTDEEVRAEAQRRRDLAGPGAAPVDEAEVRRELAAERTEREIRTWFSRAASKARIVLSPMEGR